MAAKTSAISLTDRSSKPLKAGTPALSKKQIAELLPLVKGWSHERGEIRRVFSFKDFHQTMEFVNAVAWISHREDHHPDLLVGYNRCEIRYSTHSVKGLSENDFICAAKVNALVE
jgi:4a-hydroxytetrahydrobiopterin dehydratase